MNLTAALLLIAQSAAPAAVSAPAPVAERATATVTIVRPVQVRLTEQGEVSVDGLAGDTTIQRNRDAAGTIWIEFS